MMPKGNVSPSQGGCWFCCNKTEDMEFTCEFDAWFHVDCLKEALQKPSEGYYPEAVIIAREFILSE